MMKVIFEEETEVGQCDYEAADAAFEHGGPDHAALFAHTQAALNGHSSLLRIEQHCYLRHGEETLEQSSVAPKIFLEPAVSRREEMVALARELHRRYAAEAREQIPARFSI
jgi:hypothetical protein